MEQLGSAENAAFIKDYVRRVWGESRPCPLDEEGVPEGWTYLGSGSFRSVWCGPDGVAYKVQHKEQQRQSNEREYLEVQRVLQCDPLPHVRIPKCSYYPDSDVVAMERVKGKTLTDQFGWRIPAHLEYSYYNLNIHYNLTDTHSENVMYDPATDELVPVDIGF